MSVDTEYSRLTGKSKMHAEVMDKFQTSARIRKPREAEWLVQKEFLRGNQYASYTNSYGLQVRPPANAAKKPRLVYNYSRVAIEILVAYLLKNSPIFSATATHGDSKSQSAAVLARQLMFHYWTYLNCDDKIERTAYWVKTAGNCFWELGWNPLAGQKRQVTKLVPDEDATGLLSQAMQALGISDQNVPMKEVTELVPEGDPYIRIRSPFEVYPDYGAETIEDAEWAITATRRPVSEVRRLYPSFAKDIVPDSNYGMNLSSQRQALASFGAGLSGLQPEKMNRVTVVEYWGRPTEEFPNGLRIVGTQNGLFEASETPPGYDHIPLAKWDDCIVPGEFWADATMRDLISPQKELNKRMGQMVQMSDTYKPKWVAVKGSISKHQIANVDDEVVEYQPGQKPDVVPPPPMPDAPVKLAAMSKEIIENSSGATPTIQGQMQGDQRSGRQIAYMGDYAMGRIGLKARHLSRFLSRAGTLLLKLIAENVQETRVAKIVGPNREAQIRQFTGADLGDCTDVKCDVGSILGFTKAERFDRMMQLADRKVIDGAQLLEGLELEDFYNLNQPIIEDRNNAYMEQEWWRSGNVPPQLPNTLFGVAYYEDHTVHLRAHNSFRKSADYRNLPPEMMAAVDKHCYIHECYVNGTNPFTKQQEPSGPMPPPQGPGDGGGPTGGAPPESRMNIQSGQEKAEGLPPVPPVPTPSQQTPSSP